jgi:type VI protein secretion system component VasF
LAAVQKMPVARTVLGVWLMALGGIALAVVSYGGVALLLGSAEARWLLRVALRRAERYRGIK